MLHGYMGRFLWVDLGTGKLREETPPEDLLRDFVGGYGIGARLLYGLIPRGADPLGPENKLVIAAGPLSGTFWPSAANGMIFCWEPEK